MSSGQEVSDNQLNLYVDGELDPSENEQILQAIENDNAIRDRVNQLQYLKSLVKNQYPLENDQLGAAALRDRALPWRAIAASIAVLTIGIVLGWMGHGLNASRAIIAASPTTESEIVAASPALVQHNRVLLHIDDNDPKKLKALVTYAESLLADRDLDDLKIEVVANARGLDIFRAGPGSEKARLQKLSRKYSNLELFACANAIARLREKGVKVDLIPEAHTGATALDHIIQRMQEGWDYHKI
jgi:intracellular sulfur oxidation DsrE/DsrF family protein